MRDLEGLEKAAHSLGTIIKETMPKDVGFFLLMFTFGKGGWSTFVSSADREDMILALEELLERMKTDPNRKKK